jgi:hypothetical protein
MIDFQILTWTLLNFCYKYAHLIDYEFEYNKDVHQKDDNKPILILLILALSQFWPFSDLPTATKLDKIVIKCYVVLSLPFISILLYLVVPFVISCNPS